MGDSRPAPEGVAASNTGRLAHRVYLFTDIVDSTAYKRRHGEGRARAAILAHDDLFRELLARAGGSLNKDTGDGFLAIFQDAVSAIRFALDFQSGLARLGRELALPEPVRVRVSLHQGQAWFHPDPLHISGDKLIGLVVDQSARLLRLTGAGQIRMTREVFDRARAGWDGGPAHWFTLGERSLGAGEEIIELCGVSGPEESSPSADQDNAKIDEPSDVIVGWRPAAGRSIPGLSDHTLIRLLGVGAFGEVWEAAAPDGSTSAFKFCFSTIGLRGLRREVSLFAMIRDKLQPGDPIVPLLGSRLDSAPYYIRMPVASGNLADWIRARPDMPPGERIQLAARIAESLEMTHALGVIHGDVKPLNILMFDGPGGVRPALSDFGIGKARQALIAKEAPNQPSIGVTALSGRDLLGGTRIYMAPEIQRGGPSTIQSDIYALGVVLYQLFIGDFSQPIAEGWQRALKDPLLCEDVARAIDLDPARRFGSADEVAGSLRAIEARRRRLERLTRRERARRRVTHPVTLLSVGLIAITAVSILYFQFTRERLKSASEVRELIARQEENAKAARQLSEKADYDRYVASISQASSLIRSGRPLQAREELLNAPVGPRDWEWSALMAVSVPESLILRDGGAGVRRADYSSDGARIVSVANDGKARVWDGVDGNLLERIDVSVDPVIDLSFLPENRGFALAGEDGHLSAWAFDGANHFKIRAHDKSINRVLVHPTRPWLLTASDDATLGVWSVMDGSLVARLTGHTNWVNDFSLDPTGRWLASASDDARARIWDLDRLGESIELGGHAGPVNHIAFSPDGRHVATTSDDTSVKVWNAADGLLVQTLQYHETPTRFVRWMDSERLITTALRHEVPVWRLGTTEPLIYYAENGLDPRSVEYIEDHQYIIAGGTDGYVRLFDLTRDHIHRLQTHVEDVLAIRMRPDRKAFLCAGSDGVIKVYSLRGRDLKIANPMGNVVASVTAADLGPEDLSLIGNDKGALWSINDGCHVIAGATPHPAHVRAIVWLPGTREFAVGYDDGVVLKVNGALEITARLLPAPAPVRCMFALADGILFVGDDAGSVTRWDWRDASFLNRSRIRSGHAVLKMGVKASNTRFSVFEDGNVIWQDGEETSENFLETGRQEGMAHFTAMAVSEDGELIAGVLDDKTGGVWRSRDGTVVSRFKLNLGEVVERMDFAPSNRRLLIFPNDHVPVVIDPQSGRELYSLEMWSARKRGYGRARAGDDRTLLALESGITCMVRAIPPEAFRDAEVSDQNLTALAKLLSRRAREINENQRLNE